MDARRDFVWFVDFDGVTCTQRANLATGRHDDPIAFGLLGQIVRDTNGLIVVSSARRTRGGQRSDTGCIGMLTRYGLFDHLHPDWRTPDLGSRSMEIDDWLDRNGRPNYGILDDERHDFSGQQLQRLIHTDMDFGLGARDVGRARRLAGTADAIDLRHAQQDDGAHQSPRLTIASQATLALDALDQGDDDLARRLIGTIVSNPLAR